MEEKPLEYLVDSLIPDYIKEEYPTYVSFITEYLKILEEDTGPFKVLNEITKFIDVDITPEDTLQYFVSQYLNSFPTEFLEEINIREFITNSKNFYSQKGNEAAVRFIFNLTGGSLDFYYPSEYIFETNNSTLSGSDRIHDNHFYAYYVYEIITDLSFDVYEDILRKMSHPIGEKVFFKKLVYSNTDGIIFDADVIPSLSEIDIGIDIPVDFEDMSDLIYYHIKDSKILDAKVSNLSDFIEDYFFTATGQNIIYYKDLSVYNILFEGAAPTEILIEA